MGLSILTHTLREHPVWRNAMSYRTFSLLPLLRIKIILNCKGKLIQEYLLDV
jgi:hypothetical protein